MTTLEGHVEEIDFPVKPLPITKLRHCNASGLSFDSIRWELVTFISFSLASKGIHLPLNKTIKSVTDEP